jgi:hypothetical protein
MRLGRVVGVCEGADVRRERLIDLLKQELV